jgi:hypothetical protein
VIGAHFLGVGEIRTDQVHLFVDKTCSIISQPGRKIIEQLIEGPHKRN